MFEEKVFAARLRKLRKDAGDHQTDLAELLGVSGNQISEMENSRKTTSFERLVLLCQHYNVSADYLLGLTDEPRPLTAIEKEGI